ncbi:MAG: S8 family serine peptidase, partial [Blastocatellia bacterium]|nr:S8 family serine peptidase [Blastocatellia bacterium]
DLDSQLAALAALEKENSLSEIEWYAGPKLLVKLSFPQEFSDDEASKAILALQAFEAVEKVVVQSAANLEFKSADFARSWKPDEVIPEAARRGFDVDRLNRPPVIYDQKTELPLHVANRIIVRWKDEFVWNGEQRGLEQQLAAFNAQAECDVVEERQYTDHDLTQILEFDAVKYSVLDQLLIYQANEMVDYVQPDYLYETQTVPNDPGYASLPQWSLPKISAPSAWGLPTGTGSDSVIIGILDSGANTSHSDFLTNLWTGQANAAVNFITTPPSTNVSDPSNPSHGNNVASIVGAQGNNGIYITGVAWNVSLMHVKVINDQTGTGTSSQIAAGIDYARTRVSAMNLSLGYFLPDCMIDPETGNWVCEGYELDLTLSAAIGRAKTSNAVAVCAAGNGLPNINIGLDTDNNTFSPAGTPTDNVISVAASDQNDIRPTFSNYGKKTVDLAAPGVAIYGLNSVLGTYSIFTGTSQATPHVTGTVALIKAKYGWENYYGLRDRVLMGTDDVPAFDGFTRTGGRLNAEKALHARTLIRNVSTRARVENGDKIMIGGFIIGGSGTGTLKIAIRGLGPSLDPYINVAALPNPKLTLKNSSGTTITSNDNWVNMPSLQKTDFINADLDKYQGASINSVESGIVWTLTPGAYSVFVESNNGTSFGVGLFEIYELEDGADEQTRLLNVSTRCLVRTGQEKAIAGVILGD